MTIGNFVKTIQNIMRGDSGINGDAQRIEQMTWILFLKVYDAKEEDWEFHDDNYESRPPEGCECIEDKLVTVGGLRIVGLGGSPLYSGGRNQYTERQMEARIRKLGWKIRRAGGVDIVLTHAPARGFGDADDIAWR